MITYIDSISGIKAEQLQGFFEGWASPPSPNEHLKILRGSSEIVLALDEGRVIGFITAISDEVLSAYIPFLEILPDYRGRGIGSELVRRMLDKLRKLYMIDLLCDPDVFPFYEKLGMRPATGAMVRNYAWQD